MARLSNILSNIKNDLQHYLPEQSILAAVQAEGHTWRERQLGPVQTLHLFIIQVMACNTAMAHLRHIAGQIFSVSAYCDARKRLPLAALQTLLRESSLAMRKAVHRQADAQQDQAGLWHGLRAFLVDGSSTITPDTPDLQKTFGYPSGQKPGCGFPVPKLLALFDAFTGMVVEMLGFPLFTHELSKVWMLHPLLKAGDLIDFGEPSRVVGDRGFCSFVHLAMLESRGVKACFRCHHRQKVIFRGRGHRGSEEKINSEFVRRLGKRDQIVRWKRPVKAPAWMTQEQWDAIPESLEVREMQYTLANKGQRTHVVTIATTLVDETLYPQKEVADLYGTRWRVETRFAELKTTLKMRKLKSKSADGVMKELAVYCLVYNMVRAVAAAAALRQKVDPERISFIDALRWLLWAAPGASIPDLVVNPLRPNRHQPRVIKDLQDTYTKMTRPRAQLRNELKLQGKTD